MATDPNKPNTPDPNPPPPPATNPPPAGRWRGWHTFALLLLLAGIGVACCTLPPHASFLVTMGLLAVFLVVAGHGVVGHLFGVLIDERNRMSMSRLQTVLWTVVVLSGYLAAAVWNVIPPEKPFTKPKVAAGQSAEVVPNPKLGIGVPAELWMVMGVSVTSLAVSPLILRQLMTPPTGFVVPATVTARDSELAVVHNQQLESARQQRPGAWTPYALGRVLCWWSPQHARLAELFQGDQVANAAHLDLGKVQVFFFTLVLVFAYVVMLVQEFFDASGGAAIAHLPKLDQGMVALLGISHAGYLGNKAVPRGGNAP